jgi:hypothetical protein
MEDEAIENKIKELKKNFTSIIDSRSEILNIFQSINIVIKELNEIYMDFIKDTTNKLDVFGLNPFHFQCKLVQIEYDDMQRYFLAICNRMYGDYFKLYKIVVEYIQLDVKDEEIIKSEMLRKPFPVYKDLEPFKQYDFDTIKSVNDTIIVIFNMLFHNLVKKEYSLKNHTNKNKSGLNIDNYVNTYKFEIIVLREKLVLFIDYMKYYQEFYTKYFNRCYEKLLLMNDQLNNDVHLNHSKKETVVTQAVTLTKDDPPNDNNGES